MRTNAPRRRTPHRTSEQMLLDIQEQMQTCTDCHARKPLDDFHKMSKNPTGRRPNCRQCNTDRQRSYRQREMARDPEAWREKLRAARRLKVYDLTTEQYALIVLEQDGGCGCCGAALSNIKVCVDHDHATGEVRGLLCDTCNTGIGMLGDDIEGLRRALSYLEG